MSEVGEIYDIVLGLCIKNSLDRAIVLNVQQVPFRQLSLAGSAPRIYPPPLQVQKRGHHRWRHPPVPALSRRRASGTRQGTRSLLQACSSALEPRWAMGRLLAGALLWTLALRVDVEVVKVSATFASTVASIAVSVSRVLRIPASTVAGTSAVGRDAVCVSAVDVASLEQATAVSPEITKTIRMIILIFYSPVPRNFNRPYRQVKPPPALTGANSSSASSPFPSVCEGRSGRGLASAIPAAKSHASALGTGLRCRNSRGRRQLHPHPGPRSSSRICPCGQWATAARFNCFNRDSPKAPAPCSIGPWRGAGAHSPVYRGSPKRSGHAYKSPSSRRSRCSSPRRCAPFRR